MKQIFYQGFCAGISCVQGLVNNDEESLTKLKKDLSDRVRKGEFSMVFGLNKVTATELCVDFYELQCIFGVGFSIKK